MTNLTFILILVGQFLLVLGVYIFIIEKIAKNKSAYFKLVIPGIIAIVIVIVTKLVGRWIECQISQDAYVCGVSGGAFLQFLSWIVAGSFIIIALAVGVNMLITKARGV